MTILPAGWAEASLDQITEINPRHPKNIHDSLPVTFVRMPAVSETSPSFQFTEERKFVQVRKGFTHFAEGDVLFAKITPCMENGKAAVASNLLNGLGCGTTELHVLRPGLGINSRYLYYFIHRDSFREDAARNFTGTAGQLRVPVDFIRGAQIPLAPANEQRRIVAKLDKLLSCVDAAQVRLDAVPRLLKRFRQSVLSAACSGRLTSDWRETNTNANADEELRLHAKRTASEPRNTRRMKPAKGLNLIDFSSEFPDQWSWTKVRELVRLGALKDVQDGNHGELYPRKEDFGEVGIPYITAENVINNTVQIHAAPRLRKEKASQLRIGFARAGDVILTHNATVGRVGLLSENSPDVVLSTSTTYYRVDKSVLLPAYLATYLRSDYFQRQLEAVMEQTTRNQVSVTKQVEFGVSVPPFAEQQEIVRRVEALFKTADALEARYRKAKAHVDKLTQSILAKAFRGELVPQDPNDEPASALLERLRGGENRNRSAKPSRKSHHVQISQPHA